LLVLVLVGGCAGTIRNRIRTSALVVGETALTIDDMERQLAKADPPIYTSPAQQREVSQAVLAMLTTARAYERAVKAWPIDAVTMPHNIWEAQTAALNAIATVEHVLTGVPGTDKLLATLRKLRIYIGG
jgi:hypothetical protein